MSKKLNCPQSLVPQETHKTNHKHISYKLCSHLLDLLILRNKTKQQTKRKNSKTINTFMSSNLWIMNCLAPYLPLLPYIYFFFFFPELNFWLFVFVYTLKVIPVSPGIVIYIQTICLTLIEHLEHFSIWSI